MTSPAHPSFDAAAPVVGRGAHAATASPIRTKRLCMAAGLDRRVGSNFISGCSHAAEAKLS